ncbi:methyltransferase regulatory domain-containing protein [Rickettsiales bacterium]|nr:methyltransferase regulatory domain-containing protein [Rickettsiales bacterium]
MSAEKKPANSNDYNTVPYINSSHAQSQPERLYSVAKFFNMNVPDFKNARILELGCASGSNIIPIATNFPDTKIVGVDLSSVQIDNGQKEIDELGLKNIELKQMSISDIDENFGTFDYIIVHGVLSWVPTDVQDKIFEICNKNLSKNGLAYISYNTLPGWNMVQSIRDMMLYHTENFDNPADKVHQARLVLNFIRDANENSDTPYTNLIRNEVKLLENQPDAYLAHDHLEENNKSFYFYEFMKKADDNNLRYVGDSEIQTMFVGNLPENVTSILSQTSNDVVRTEQYMDFIRNRRFRASIICHKENEVNRTIVPDNINGFYLSTTLILKDEENTGFDKFIKSGNKEEASFINPISGDEAFRTTNPLMIAAMRILHNQNKKPILIDEIIEKARQELKDSNCTGYESVDIRPDLQRLILAGSVKFYSHDYDFVNTVSEKPKASELIRNHVRTRTNVTNQLNASVTLDLFGRVLVSYLDGSNDLEKLTDFIISHAEKGELNVNIDGKKIEDAEVLRNVTKQLIQRQLQVFAANAILVA